MEDPLDFGPRARREPLLGLLLFTADMICSGAGQCHVHEQCVSSELKDNRHLSPEKGCWSTRWPGSRHDECCHPFFAPCGLAQQVGVLSIHSSKIFFWPGRSSCGVSLIAVSTTFIRERNVKKVQDNQSSHLFSPAEEENPPGFHLM